MINKVVDIFIRYLADGYYIERIILHVLNTKYSIYFLPSHQTADALMFLQK